MIFINMTQSQIKALIKEEVAKVLIIENIDALRDNISTTSIVGKYWNGLVSSLSSLMEEVTEFSGLYSSQVHGPLPNTSGGIQKLMMIVKLLEEVKPLILSMDDIQKKDI
jgi:hypothetical protein